MRNEKTPPNRFGSGTNCSWYHPSSCMTHLIGFSSATLQQDCNSSNDRAPVLSLAGSL